MAGLSELRDGAKRAREALGEPVKAAAAIRVAARFGALPALETARAVLAYAPAKGELDSWPLLRRAWALGKAVALPRVDQAAKTLSFWRIEGPQDLEPGPFGILQPKLIESRSFKPRSADLILVPGLLFGKNGSRLGWGQGFYDRYLAGEGGVAVSIGLAFDVQVSDMLPQEAHDKPVDWLLTESSLHDCRSLRGA